MSVRTRADMLGLDDVGFCSHYLKDCLTTTLYCLEKTIAGGAHDDGSGAWFRWFFVLHDRRIFHEKHAAEIVLVDVWNSALVVFRYARLVLRWTVLRGASLDRTIDQTTRPTNVELVFQAMDQCHVSSSIA